ncbi:MAG: beta-ketoacyl-ACP synthase [Rhodobiaceae bacterium]|nr:beta-ketoacyl-ACP synthase [Rhodobiaceae bacterium]
MSDANLDHKGRPVIVVTGVGVVTSLGAGRQDNWAALTAGKSGIHQITRFPTEGLRTTIGGTVDFLKDVPISAPLLTERFAVLAVEEAVAQAKIGSAGNFPGPLFMAVPPVEVDWPQRFELYEAGKAGGGTGYARLFAGARSGDYRRYHELSTFGWPAERIAEKFGTRGGPVSLSTACASGASAIQLGLEALRRGDCAAALCVGSDGSVHAEAVIRFSLLSALSTSNNPPEAAAKPFSADRDGFVVAEGAGALVLETLDHARARGAEILAVLRGCGERADDFHRTRSKPDGSSIIGAIERAMDDAGLAPDEIDYVNAHGTGTPENDKMEYLGLSTVLGDALTSIPVSSNKSMIGHSLTAAGAVEAVFSILTMRTGRIPPTINYNVPDPAIPLDVVPNVARDASVATVMSNSFGFGGQNLCLVLAAEPA